MLIKVSHLDLSGSGAVLTDRRTAERRIMQVSSSVNTGYYAQYHSSSSAKKSADNLAFEVNYASNETEAYQRSGKTEDYQEYYKAWMLQGNSGVIEYANGNSTVNSDIEEMVDYAKVLEEKMNEIFAKIQSGNTEPTFQIGSQSFTEKEWEEFLDKFDSVEEAIQELMKEEQAIKEAEEAGEGNAFTDDASTLLTTESTSCVYETANPDDDDIHYITWYTEEGIFCRKVGQTEGYEWAITFENKEQYDKFMEFIGQFSSDWNMRFAAHKNFWIDFLNDEIDMEGFMEFINGTK